MSIQLVDNFRREFPEHIMIEGEQYDLDIYMQGPTAQDPYARYITASIRGHANRDIVFYYRFEKNLLENVSTTSNIHMVVDELRQAVVKSLQSPMFEL